MARQALLLFAVALILRLAYLAELSRSLLGIYLLGDGIGYDAWARRIAAGDWLGSEVFYQAPLYPYLLAIIYRLAAGSILAVRIAQAVAGAASCVLVAYAGRRFFGAREGWAAGLLLAFYPPAIFFDGEIQKASFDLLFASLLLFFVARLRDDANRGWAIAAGVTVALFALNRENALLLLPLLAFWLFLLPGMARPQRVAAAVVFAAATLATLLPVALRNRAIGGELLVTTSQLGPNLYIGNHPGAGGRYEPLRAGRGSAQYEREDATALAEAASHRRLAPAEVSRYWRDRALGFMRDQPGAWLALMGRKWLLVWNRREIVDTTSLEAAADFSILLRTLARVLHFGVLAPLAIAGIWLTRRQWRSLLILYLMLAAWALAVAAFFVLARYRYPMVPILALFAGAALVAAEQAIREHRIASILPAAALAIAGSLFVNQPLRDPDPRATTYASLGNAAADAGHLDEGIRMLAHAVELSTNFGEAHLALGHLQVQSGDLDDAAVSYRRSIEISPSAAAWNNLGLIAAGRGQLDAAIEAFRRAVDLEPRYTQALHNLARMRFQARDFAEAQRLYARLLEIDPADATAHHQLGNLHGFAGDLTTARQHYERALAADPRLADAHFKLAVIFDRLGENDEGTSHLARAIELAPAYGQRLLRLGEDAEKSGRKADAVRIYRTLLAAAPGNAAAAKALERLGG